MGRVAAGVVGLVALGLEGPAEVLVDDAVGGAVDAFHFVEDHALVLEFAVGLEEFVVPALLLEHAGIEPGVEDGVEVDIDEVVEVPEVLAGHRVQRLVAVGHRVEEGVERALHQFLKGVLDRVAPRAAEHGVLEDVGHAGGIAGGGAEGDGEDLVGVVVADREEFGSGVAVAVQAHVGVEFVDALVLEQFEIGVLGGGWHVGFSVRWSWSGGP